MRKAMCAVLAALFVCAITLPALAAPRWVDFDVPATAMAKALDYDVASYGSDAHVDWLTLLALSATRHGGNWSRYKASEMSADATRLAAGETPAQILPGYKSYEHYYTAYRAVLGGFLGEHLREVPRDGVVQLEPRYGLMAYSPIAEGWGYSHCKDFGNSRSFGYRRRHLGNDLMGRVGTPIIAVEGGKIEELGWNRYGGWRIGIRSHDHLRYYYYAHLRKDHPWPEHLEVGMSVQGGDVIGYLGMTGYSTKENVNGMRVPHLHFGLQLVFDDAKKDAPAQNWIDVYEIVKLLSRNRATVVRHDDNKDYERKYRLSNYHYATGE